MVTMTIWGRRMTISPGDKVRRPDWKPGRYIRVVSADRTGVRGALYVDDRPVTGTAFWAHYARGQRGWRHLT